jgi:hypothetical protein
MNRNNINKTWTPNKTNGSKNETNIDFTRKSKRTSQHGTKKMKNSNLNNMNLTDN